MSEIGAPGVNWDRVTARVRRDALARKLRGEAARLENQLIAFRRELGEVAALLREAAAEVDQC